MTEAQAIGLMIEHMKGQFPKTCPNCQRRFNTLRDFYASVEPVGKPISYDLESGDLNPAQPVGSVAMSNCPCGSTLAVTSDGMPLLRLWSLLHWAKRESQRRGVKPEEFLEYLRWETRKQVLAEPDSASGASAHA